ncbi:MAG: shikimate dehydrogenase [Hyphomicrobiaceae bacterium]|nr:shikimate dehydrogenase [Hyphomicrobiaceae bacterium]
MRQRAERRACVIGWPIAHSRSPLIHCAWLARYGIAGSYTREPVRPEDLAGFLGNLGQHGLVGCNVTIPHKEGAFALAHRRLPAAEAIGAANTLWLEGDTLCADSTDGAGFMANLAATAPGFSAAGRAVAILGAGGAVRSIVHALLAEGAAEVRLVNRTMERAQALAAHFGPRVVPVAWSDMERACRDAALLVNATALGMKGQPPLDLDVGVLGEAAVVADIVYVPLLTPLLAAARARGLTTVDGLGMLLHQAVPGFERWFGVRPEVTPEVRALVVADLENA